MAQTTKILLFESFKKLLEVKPVSKITITDITDGVGVNRHTFYYHFKDLNSLMTWGFDTSFQRLLDGFDESQSMDDKLQGILEYAEKEKKFILAVFHSDLRDHLERILEDWTCRIVKSMVMESSREVRVKDDDLYFVIDFMKFGISGLVIDWLAGGMMENPEKFSNRIAALVSGGGKELLEKYRVNK